MRRSANIRACRLTVRDSHIIHQIHRYRFLRSDQIVALLRGSRQQILRRLQLLYHHRYLERPRSQIDYYHQGGSRSFVYGITAKGRSLLSNATWNQPHSPKSTIHQLYLQHTLLIADVVIGIDLACRSQKLLRFIPQDELISGQPMGWQVQVRYGAVTKRLSVYPDQIFALDGAEGRTVFLLEADRATMPIERRGLGQSSVFRKLLAYEALWKQRLLQKQFGSARFRVLFVTSSPSRTARVISAVQKLVHGRGLFLCTDIESFRKVENKLTFPWSSFRSTETDSLLA